jgi:hypothetical protein
MWKIRCEATTKKGTRCKKKKVCDHFCTIHNPEYITPETTCPICYDKMDSKIVLACNHPFCKDCIYKWICKGKNSCPMCRSIITDYHLKNDAWEYGVQNKLLCVAKTSVYDIRNFISVEEYEIIREHIVNVENQFLTTSQFLYIILTMGPDMASVFNKLTITPILVNRLLILPEGLTDYKPEEYHQFLNRDHI